MNESVLNALIHLFSLVAVVNKEQVPSAGREIVKTYLRRYLNEDLTDEYLSVFDNYLDFYFRELTTEETRPGTPKDNLISTQVSSVCHQIKKELMLDERIQVFIHLFEIVNEDLEVTTQELEFVSIVATEFNIAEEEYSNLKEFILHDVYDKINPRNLLVIDNQLQEWSQEIAWFMSKKKGKTKEPDKKHIYVEYLYGKISILLIESINAFLFRFTGAQSLYLESQRIIPGKSYFINRGSILKGPNIRPIYYSEIAEKFLAQTVTSPIFLSVRELEFRFKQSKNGIHPFNFQAQSGEMIAIMGGSGVGKSTLLSLLNGKLKPNAGKILINGYDLYRNSKQLEGVIGFVPQDDLLIEELSVYQNLYFNAKLCFKDYSETEIRATVDRVMDDLDLREVRSLKVGNPLNKYISGGQRKRLNIGLEIMREPSVMYVDEPTSGLSSMDSDKVMALLRKQAEKGKIIIANIHQPSSETFKLFDKLIVLDKGGHPIYTGNPIEAIVYFKIISSQVNAAESECSRCGNVNPEQILQIVEAKKIDDYGGYTGDRKIEPEDWYRHYREDLDPGPSMREGIEPLPASHFAIPNVLNQFKIYSIRNILTKISDRQYILINLLEAPLLAAILGYFTKYISGIDYVFLENKNLPIFLFMSVIVALFMGLTVSAEEIIKDRKLLERESFLSLSKMGYINSKIIYLFTLSAIQTLTFVLLGNLILDIKGMFLPYWIILFSTASFGNMVGLNISSGLKSVVNIYILIPLILVPQLLLGGAMIHYDDLHPGLTSKKHVPLIGDIMVTRWAYEALAVEQFKNNDFQKEFFDAEQKLSETNYYNSFLIPRLQNIVEDILWIREMGVEEDFGSDNRIVLLRNELGQISTSTGQPPFELLDLVEENQFNEETAEETLGYLYYLKTNLQEEYQDASHIRDSLYDYWTDQLGMEGFQLWRNEYMNEALSNLVRNTNKTVKLVETGNEIVQKLDPIYIMPQNDTGRASFYAPFKKINQRLIDTLVFNTVVIWLFSVIMYLTLLTDLLKKFITYFETMKIRRRSRQNP